jgi:3-deoxy-D-manno-oct-2-ulosonic acid (Kdo) hydroxylase
VNTGTSPLTLVDIASWRPSVSSDRTEELAQSLESGAVLVLPNLAFELDRDEQRFLDPKWSDGSAKNISFDSGAVKGARGTPADLAALARMIGRFATCASDLIAALLPRYASHLKRARTSFRTQPATGRSVSWPSRRGPIEANAFCVCSAT